MKLIGSFYFLLALSICPATSFAMGKGAPTGAVTFDVAVDSMKAMSFLATDIGNNELATCYGVWISRTQILTAAHCVSQAVDHPEKVFIYSPTEYPDGLWDLASNVRLMDQKGCPEGDHYNNSSICPADDLAIVETKYANSHVNVFPLIKQPELTVSQADDEIIFTAIYQSKEHTPGTLIFEPVVANDPQSDGTAAMSINRKWSDGIGPGISGMPVFGLSRAGEISVLGIITAGKKHIFGDVTLFGMDLGMAKAMDFLNSSANGASAN